MDGRHPSGGSRWLAELVDDYGEHVAADLLETYGVDLRDIFTPESRLTPRWIAVLVNGLPVGSRYMAERRGGQQFRDWTPQVYALVSCANTLRSLQYVTVAINSKTKPKLPAPFPIPDRPVRKKLSGSNSFAAIAAKHMGVTKEG